MRTKKLLAVGCSFTEDCGFRQNIHHHWLQQFAKKHNFELTNVGQGGGTNVEIFLRTVEEITACADYDFVTVQWTSLQRLWVYHNNKNIDHWTQIHALGNAGLHSDRDYVKMYQKIHYGYFNNQYVELKQWLLYTIALQIFLKSHGLEFVFIRGFGNYLDTMSKVYYNKNTGFENTTQDFVDMFDLHNSPDDLILKKLSVIQNLIKQSQSGPWLNFASPPFNRLGPIDDRADDNEHPGPVANKNLFKQLTDYYAKLI